MLSTRVGRTTGGTHGSMLFQVYANVTSLYFKAWLGDGAREPDRYWGTHYLNYDGGRKELNLRSGREDTQIDFYASEGYHKLNAFSTTEYGELPSPMAFEVQKEHDSDGWHSSFTISRIKTIEKNSAPPSSSMPGDLLASYSVSNQTVNVSFTVRGMPVYLYIERSENGGSYKVIKTYNAPEIGKKFYYTDTSVIRGKYYTYRIRQSEYLYSSDGYTSATPVVYTETIKPKNVKARLTGELRATVTWEADTNNQYFFVYRSTAPNDPKPTLISDALDGNVRSFVDANAKGAKIYYYVQSAIQQGSSYSFSGYVEADQAVAALAKPAKPKLTGLSRYLSIEDMQKGGAPRFSWTHNSLDGSEQQDAEVEYTITPKGSSSSSKKYNRNIGKTASYSLHKTLWAEPCTIELRVKTKGLHPSWSDYSDPLIVKIEHSPTLVITKPSEDNKTYTTTPINIAFNAGTRKLVSKEIVIYNDETGERLKSFSDVSEASLTMDSWVPPNNSTFRVQVNAVDEFNFSVSNQVKFKTRYKEPAAPIVNLKNNADDLSCAISVRFGQQTNDAEATVKATIARVDSNGREFIYTDVRDNQTVVDIHPPLTGAYHYEVASYTAAGAFKAINVSNELGVKGMFALNYGDGCRKLAKLSADAERGHQVELEQEVVSYLGRKKPVLYSGTSIIETIPLKGSIHKSEDIRAWHEASLWAGRCIYRDCYGYRESVAASISCSEPAGARIEYIEATLKVVE